MALLTSTVVALAYGRSTKNQPGRMVNEGPEVIGVVRRAVQGLFAVGARVNPEFFSLAESVASVAGAWPRPATAESVWRIERPSGAEVIVVPRWDRQADTARPAVCRLGQRYYPAGNPGDPPTSEELTMLFAKAPAAIPTLASPIDPFFPDHFEGLLVDEVAIYLALKDGRVEEVPPLTESRNAWLALYVAFLEHETASEVRRFGATRAFTVPELTPLLAGGQVKA
jgi:hypothetical protein